MSEEQILQQEAALMSVVVESLLYACEPSFALEERNELVYISVLEKLKLSNPEVFDAIQLENITLFLDQDAADSEHVSSIIQLLGDKLTVVDART